MKRKQDGRGKPRLLADSPQFNGEGLFKAGIFSMLLHIGLIVMLGISARPVTTKAVPSVYRVTLRPFSPSGYGIQKESPGSGLSGPLKGTLSSIPREKLKHVWDPKWSEIVEGIKPAQKKAEKKVEKSEKGEKIEKGGSLESLQDSIEDIRKKVALDEIQKRVSRRESKEKLSREGRSIGEQFTRGPIVSSSRNSPLSGSGPETGMGNSGILTGGPKAGPPGGPLGGPPGESPWSSSVLESKLNDYYNMIWAKIKKEWTLPENLPEGKTDLETIIIIVIEREGKVQKSWFEKKSGNALYDQMAMRAIKKAEPLPPIPKEFSNEPFEIGIRFHPD